MRCVVDTNVVVSASVFTFSVPRQAVENVLRNSILLFSDFTMDELKNVLVRSKFDRYVSREERALFLAQLNARAELVPTIRLVRECRDPKDDKVLAVAVAGRADYLVRGDKDLRVLERVGSVPIVTPAAFLASVKHQQ